ncbi:MAG TPA: ABC transporter substrate-binding protein [Terriglobales bacterium]|nr:ABC transporter substrate-binding protein [Terriglobales bacterium]
MKKNCMFVLSLAVALFAFAFSPQKLYAEKLIVGVSSVNVAFLPLYVTEDKGFFKDEGLEVLLVMFNAGNTNLQSLAGGDVQIMASAVAETVLGRAGGMDVQNFWGVCNLMPFELYARPGLKSMKDARGKKFAISRFGSLSDFLTRASLRHFGIDPKEVTILQIGSTPARFAALSSGGVDATIIWFPVTEQAKALGFRRLLSLKEVFPEWPYETFAARQSWLKENKDQAVRFLRAYQRGLRYTLDNRDEAIRILNKYVKMDPKYAPAGYDLYRGSFPPDGRIAEKGIELVAEQEFANGRIKRKVTLDEMIDRTFMKMLGGK